MYPKSIEKYHKVRKAVESGVSLSEALKAEKMAAVTYYQARKETKKTERKPAKAKSAHEFFDIAAPQAGETIAVVVCTVSNLKKVLGVL